MEDYCTVQQQPWQQHFQHSRCRYYIKVRFASKVHKVKTLNSTYSKQKKLNASNVNVGAVGDVPVGDVAVGDIAVGDIAVGDVAVGDVAVGDDDVGDVAVGDAAVGADVAVYCCALDM